MADPDTPTDRDSALLAAAEEVFARYGYRRVSMEDLAEAMGLSRAGLYKRFSNKETLFRAAVSRLHEDTLVRVEQATRSPASTTTLELVTAAFEARIGYLMDRVWDSPHGMEILEDTSRLCGDIVADASDRFRAQVAVLLERGHERGEIDLDAADLGPRGAADLIAAAVVGLKSAASGPKEFRDSMRRVIRLLLAGMTSKHEKTRG